MNRPGEFENRKEPERIENQPPSLGFRSVLADALIGATVWILGEPLLTGNVRHYRVLKDIKLVKFRTSG